MSGTDPSLTIQTPEPATSRGLVIVQRERFSARISLRSVVVTAVLVVLAAVVAVVALGTGELGLSVGTVVRSLLGAQGGFEQSVVVNWRLPRVIAALVFGAGLAVSGAIFQTLTRNPLGSPDVIGFNTGAYTGALVVMLVIGGGYALVSVGALIGGLVTAIVVYLLSRTGGASGLRLIIVGIGVSAMLSAFNRWLILQADLVTSMSAAVWGAGTLNGLRWPQVNPALVTVAVLVIAAALLSRQLRVLELGDEAASGLGAIPSRVRLALLLVAVMLTAAVTAVAGPIAFIALSAPQLAKRVTRSAGILILPSAAMGALLLAASDLLAQLLFAPIPMPVGMVTVTIGGVYLMLLLIREARSR